MRKSLLFIVSIGWLLIGCNRSEVLPEATSVSPTTTTVESTPRPTKTPEIGDSPAAPSNTASLVESADYGISFQYDQALAAAVTWELRAGLPASDNPENDFGFDIMPDHIVATFTNSYATDWELYRTAVNLTTQPQITVFPAAAYSEMNQTAQQQMEQLGLLLQEKPALLAGELPFLPPPNAHQELQAQIAYLSFQNGEGVRYLTQYTQEMIQVSNQSVFYTFQGLTADGEAYVSVSFPVRSAALTDTLYFGENFDGNLADYLAQATAELNGLSTVDFEPDLATLDAMVASLLVEPTVSFGALQSGVPALALPEMAVNPRSDAGELPRLPRITPLFESQGNFPTAVRWALNSALPEGETAVLVTGQAVQPQAPLSAEAAAELAARYGFTEELFVEWHTTLSVAESAAIGWFVAFDGTRSLSLSSSPYYYNDSANVSNEPDLSFAEAAPIAEKFLLDQGWLTFAYQTQASTQGEGVLFYPQVDGLAAAFPAFAVRVAANGHIAAVMIWPDEPLTAVGQYPILQASTAWEQLQSNPNAPGMVYQIYPPATGETDVLPTYYRNIPAPGETADVYTLLSVYRPLSNTGLPRISSTEFSQILGDGAMLNALAENSTGVVHLWGTVDGEANRPTLLLEGWEALPQVGPLALISGLYQEANGNSQLETETDTYLLTNVPAAVQPGDYVEVYGLPRTAVNGRLEISWQDLTRYPAQTDTPAELAPIQQLTIQEVTLVSRLIPAVITGLDYDLSVPVWQFKGEADNGAAVIVWVTAVQPEWLKP